MPTVFPKAGIPHYSLDQPGIPLFAKLWRSTYAAPPPEVAQLTEASAYWSNEIEVVQGVTDMKWVPYKSPAMSKWIDLEELKATTFVEVTFKMKACVYAENKVNAGGTIILRTPKQDERISDALCWAQVIALPGYEDGFAQREDIKYARVTLPLQSDLTFKWEVYNALSSQQPNYTALSCWLSGYYKQS